MTGIGVGLYTLADAARLVSVEKRTIKRWLTGYSYLPPGEAPARRRHRFSGPLWQPQFAPGEFREPVIGFLDLLELRFVERFVKCGVPLIVVRRCLETARELFGSDHPFTRYRFSTDGETIFQEALQEASLADKLLNLRTRQYAFREIIRESLYSGIEYRGKDAARWFPVPKSKVVMIDPEVQFGRPALAASGVPTASLYAAWLAEGKETSAVARLFEVPPREVSSAVRYEQGLSQAA